MERSENAPELLTQKLVRQHFLPVGERTLFRMISAGHFPRPDIAIGGKQRYWKGRTVQAWIDSQSPDEDSH